VLALLLTCSAAAAGSSRLAPRHLAQRCAAEARCLSTACSDAYTSTDLPYTALYTTTTSANTTTFSIVACSSTCTASASGACAPLQSLGLRLNDALLADPGQLSVVPSGTPVPGCSDAGTGLRWTGGALGSLATTSPAQVRREGRVMQHVCLGSTFGFGRCAARKAGHSNSCALAGSDMLDVQD
jgi:hypothetical protein